jgi:hypothetical protein
MGNSIFLLIVFLHIVTLNEINAMRTIFYIMLFFLIFDAKSQDRRIQYEFPSKADSLLRIAMDNEFGYYSFNDSMDYFIILSVSDTVYTLSLSTYCSKCEVFDSDGDIHGWVNFLATNSNRYTNILGKEVSVVLYEDFFFGVIKLIEGGGARKVRVIDRPQFKVLIDKRGFMDNKIYKAGFW